MFRVYKRRRANLSDETLASDIHLKSANMSSDEARSLRNRSLICSNLQLIMRRSLFCACLLLALGASADAPDSGSHALVAEQDPVLCFIKLVPNAKRSKVRQHGGHVHLSWVTDLPLSTLTARRRGAGRNLAGGLLRSAPSGAVQDGRRGQRDRRPAGHV